MKRFLRIFLVAVLLGFIGVVLFSYYGVYSEGVRAGMVLKISKKGTLFKTYEGQLDLKSFGAVNSKNQLSQTFEFSVRDKNVELIEKLEEAALEGTRVRLRYQEKYIALPWLGDTKYFVIAVEDSQKSMPEKGGDFPQ